MTLQIYKTAGSCWILLKLELEPSKSEGLEETQAEAQRQSQPIGRGRPTIFEFSDLEVGQLCSENNNQCCSCGLSFYTSGGYFDTLKKN